MIAKLFENGGSQAVRIPKEYRFDDKEVNVHKMFGVMLVSPKSDSWVTNLQGLELFTDDCFAEYDETTDNAR